MTTNIVFDEDYRLIGWAAERIGVECFSHDAHAIGLERDGELVAVVVYDRFSPHDCHMHVASDGSKRWLVREFLVACFAYPFIQLGLRRVTGLVPASNAAALKFDKNLGFLVEGYHHQALGDDDLITLGMLRENCRFIPKEVAHGR